MPGLPGTTGTYGTSTRSLHGSVLYIPVRGTTDRTQYSTLVHRNTQREGSVLVQ